ncbi:hypothetical protein [Leptothoe spongobia]|uniref:Uncharacterized protein n=1 Tax=Leptothoe spongobia TAU-MAC 1115 TaxID=1967444 RepID=A0A947GFW7_9CYAN|nr:hypothetical protein [Leptothoe spongobia]MBT9313828.1 hypothetical protein [Leptothoe spongobia TAU-MAC 1115]
MEQLKYSLGPFELFAAIVGGSPFILAGFLMYHPIESLADLVPVIQSSGTVAISLTILFVSYIVGGTIQGLSWKYFLRLCKLFKYEYTYFGTQLTDRDHALQTLSPNQPYTLELEDRLVIQLRKEIGIPKKSSWMDDRLKAYLREHNSPSVAASDTYIASHIMYRNLSLGCLLLCIVSLFNSVRLSSLEPLLIAPFIGYTAYLMFLRSVSFKKWQNRTLILGFYYAATKAAGCEGNP